MFLASGIDPVCFSTLKVYNTSRVFLCRGACGGAASFALFPSVIRGFKTCIVLGFLGPELSRGKRETTIKVALAVHKKLGRTVRKMYSELQFPIRKSNVDFRTFVAINVHFDVLFCFYVFLFQCRR